MVANLLALATRIAAEFKSVRLAIAAKPSTKADIGLANVTNYGITPLGPSDPIPGGTPVGLIIRK